MSTRTAAEVRNPLLALPAARLLFELPPESKAALRALLLELRRDALTRAEISWRRSKAPMAAYWRATATYAGHAAGLLRAERSR